MPQEAVVRKNLFKRLAKSPTDHEEPEKQTEGSDDKNSQQNGLISRRKMLKVLGLQVVAGTVAVNAIAAPRNFNPKHYNRGITPDQLPNTKA